MLQWSSVPSPRLAVQREVLSALLSPMYMLHIYVLHRRYWCSDCDFWTPSVFQVKWWKGRLHWRLYLRARGHVFILHRPSRVSDQIWIWQGHSWWLKIKHSNPQNIKIRWFLKFCPGLSPLSHTTEVFQLHTSSCWLVTANRPISPTTNTDTKLRASPVQIAAAHLLQK